MQAIIMAAGKGSRLGNMTVDKPKSFIEINGKRLIDINLNLLRSYEIKKIVIVTGCHADMFETMYGNDGDIELIYNPFYGFTNVIGSFYMGMGELNDDFLYLHADTLCEPSIIEDIICSDSEIAIPVDRKPCDEEAMKVKLENGVIKYISKKISLNECAGEFIGIAKIKKEVLPSLRASAKKILRNEMFSEYFEAALQDVISDEQYTVQMIETGKRFWAEIDFLEDYESAVCRIPPVLYKF